MKITHSLVILGAGGHGRAVLDAARSAEIAVDAFVDEQLAGQWIHGIKVISSTLEMTWTKNRKYLVALGDNLLRERVVERTRKELPNAEEAVLVHRTAYVAPDAVIEPGCVILANAFVGPGCKIERGCILNTGSQIDHDGHMRAYSSLGPKACLGGNVKLGRRSVVAIGSTVRHGIEIGNDSLLAAQGYLHISMPDQVIYMGIPAKLYRKRNRDDKYL